MAVRRSLTETVCELGQCHRLIGVDRYSNYPASVQALPKAGGGALARFVFVQNQLL